MVSFPYWLVVSTFSTHPKNMLVKLASSSPSFGMKSPKIFELPPPSIRFSHMGVSKNRGKTPKMDGENHGKTQVKWIPFFSETSLNGKFPHTFSHFLKGIPGIWQFPGGSLDPQSTLPSNLHGSVGRNKTSEFHLEPSASGGTERRWGMDGCRGGPGEGGINQSMA